MTRVLLIRHGHVEGIVPKRFRGRLDLPLSAEGEAQADLAAQHVSARYDVKAVYASPLQRCIRSASALTRSLLLPEPRIAPALTDTDYGLWQGRLATEVSQSEPQLYGLWQTHPEQVTFPQGESLAAVAARAMVALQALALAHAGQTIAVYTHDSVIRVIILATLHAPFAAYHRVEVDPCSLGEVVYGPDNDLELVRFNERTRCQS